MLHAVTVALVLQIWNVADVPRTVIEPVQAEVMRLYADAGVAIAWNGSPDVQVVVLDRATGDLERSNRSIMGAAVRTDQGSRIAYVFYRRIAAEADEHGVPRALVLACAIAHEVGHLLMPGRGHSPTGLMRACWGRDDFDLVRYGLLSFSRPDRAELRSSGETRAPQ
jgi:hypothetical protein